MAKEEAIEAEGNVTEALANTQFRVKLDNDHMVMCHVAGKMRKHFIRIVPGDRVIVEGVQKIRAGQAIRLVRPVVAPKADVELRETAEAGDDIDGG